MNKDDRDYQRALRAEYAAEDANPCICELMEHYPCSAPVEVFRGPASACIQARYEYLAKNNGCTYRINPIPIMEN